MAFWKTRVKNAIARSPIQLAGAALYVILVTALGYLAIYLRPDDTVLSILAAIFSIWGWLIAVAVEYGIDILLVVTGFTFSDATAELGGIVIGVIPGLAYPYSALLNVLIVSAIMNGRARRKRDRQDRRSVPPSSGGVSPELRHGH